MDESLRVVGVSQQSGARTVAQNASVVWQCADTRAPKPRQGALSFCASVRRPHPLSAILMKRNPRAAKLDILLAVHELQEVRSA